MCKRLGTRKCERRRGEVFQGRSGRKAQIKTEELAERKIKQEDVEDSMWAERERNKWTWRENDNENEQKYSTKMPNNGREMAGKRSRTNDDYNDNEYDGEDQELARRNRMRGGHRGGAKIGRGGNQGPSIGGRGNNQGPSIRGIQSPRADFGWGNNPVWSIGDNSNSSQGASSRGDSNVGPSPRGGNNRASSSRGNQTSSSQGNRGSSRRANK